MTKDQLAFIEYVVERANGYGYDYDCSVEIQSREDNHVVVVILDENDDNDDEPTRANVEVLAVEHPLLDQTLLRVTIDGDEHPQIVGASGRMLFASLYV